MRFSYGDKDSTRKMCEPLLPLAPGNASKRLEMMADLLTGSPVKRRRLARPLQADGSAAGGTPLIAGGGEPADAAVFTEGSCGSANAVLKPTGAELGSGGRCWAHSSARGRGQANRPGPGVKAGALSAHRVPGRQAFGSVAASGIALREGKASKVEEDSKSSIIILDDWEIAGGGSRQAAGSCSAHGALARQLSGAVVASRGTHRGGGDGKAQENETMPIFDLEMGGGRVQTVWLSSAHGEHEQAGNQEKSSALAKCWARHNNDDGVGACTTRGPVLAAPAVHVSAFVPSAVRRMPSRSRERRRFILWEMAREDVRMQCRDLDSRIVVHQPLLDVLTDEWLPRLKDLRRRARCRPIYIGTTSDPSWRFLGHGCFVRDCDDSRGPMRAHCEDYTVMHVIACLPDRECAAAETIAINDCRNECAANMNNKVNDARGLEVRSFRYSYLYVCIG